MWIAEVPCLFRFVLVGEIQRDSVGVFNKTIIPLALVGYEMIIANSALRASLAIYHLISNAPSWNNCEIYTRFQKGWHFKSIYVFCFFGRNKRKNKRYIYLYIFLKCQPFCKRVYIYIYTRFQKVFHTERYIDKYILLFSCTCAWVHFSLVIVQLVENSVGREIFSSSGFLFQFDMSFWVFFLEKYRRPAIQIFAKANYITDFGNEENIPRSSRSASYTASPNW